MLKNREELLDVINQYFTVKSTDKDKVYNLYIADQLVGTLTLVIKGDKVEHGFTYYFKQKARDFSHGMNAVLNSF